MEQKVYANGARDPKKIRKAVLAAVILLIVVIVAAFSFTVVPAGSTGVVVTLGKVSDRVMQEGFHLKAPFLQHVEIISNKIKVVEIDSESVSKDLQTVSSTIAVNYRVGFDASANIYKNIGREYESIVLLPAMQESMKSVTAKYTAEELITMRAQIGQEIKTALEEKVGDYGIIIDKFNIVNFDFSEEFNLAIEAKQVAEQNLIKTRTEQEEALVIANAEAQKKIIAADADAESTMKRATAQAEANRMLNDSLNENIIEYEKVQKWNGELPMATGGNAILDMSSASE